MTARRLCLGVYALLAERAEGGVDEVDEMLDASGVRAGDPAENAVAVRALGGEIG